MSYKKLTISILKNREYLRLYGMCILQIQSIYFQWCYACSLSSRSCVYIGFIVQPKPVGFMFML